MVDLRIISIGTLSAHPLWGERQPVRTGHATSTLVRSGKRAMIIDPGLPPAVIAARLNERSGLAPRDITHVFLTSFKPDTMRGISAFENATWWVSAEEREGVGVPLAGGLQKAVRDGDGELARLLEQDVAILRRCQPAPDRLADDVDLFPLPGVTPGCCGVLCAAAQKTTLICGDAVATVEHLASGLVLPSCVDVRKAQESFAEAVEIGDELVLGRDTLVRSPGRVARKGE